MTEKSSNSIAYRVARALDEVAELALRSGRRPEEVWTMAVTKRHSVEQVNEAIGAGIRLLGENRVQELLERRDGYRLEGCALHFIGQLQSNKVGQIIDKVDLVESLDRMSLALELERCAARLEQRLPVLIEVNVAREPQKGGVLPEETLSFVEQVARLPHLKVSGLMTLGPNEATELEREGYFDTIHRLFIDISAKKIDNVHMGLLSMGMSNDYRLAIKHGSNIVRLGRAIFGERQ